MGQMPTRSQLKKNLKELLKRLEDKQEDLDARMRLARTYRLLKDRRRAVSHYGQVARFLSLSGHPLQAIAVLKELLQIDQHHEETLLFLAKLYARTRGAHATNRGRVAVPIIDGESPPLALPDGLPGSATGIWRAIQPQETDLLTVVHAPEEVGAEFDDAPENTLTISEVDVLAAHSLSTPPDDDEVTERRREPLPTSKQPGQSMPTEPDRPEAFAPLDSEFDLDGDVEDAGLMGPLRTEDVVLPQVPLFSSLPPEAFVDLGNAMVFRRARPKEVLFEAGSEGHSCIVIARGRAEAVIDRDGEEVCLSVLKERDMAGLFALTGNAVRRATLRAQTSLEFFEIDRGAISKLAQTHEDVADIVEKFVETRLLLGLLARLPVFSSLDADERTSLADNAEVRSYEPEEELMYTGSPHAGLWVIYQGLVHLEGESESGEPRSRLLGPGDFFGSLCEGEDGEGTCELDAVVDTDGVKAAHIPHRTFRTLFDRDSFEGVVEQFRSASLMLTSHVFCGDSSLMGGVVDSAARDTVHTIDDRPPVDSGDPNQ